MSPAPGPAGRVTVRVPATSANLGPAFDCAGIALQRYDEIDAALLEGGLRITVAGQGADEVPRDESHLVLRAARVAFDRLGGQPPGLALDCRNDIPHGRGLGSSAAAVVAGILLARALVPGGADRLPTAELLVLADQLEGHPDNVAACLLGGLTLAWSEQPPGAEVATVRATRLDPHADLEPVVFVPAARLSTAAARGLLPDVVPHRDAARGAGRAALLVHALTSAPDLLLAATDDVLHQPYRATAMPDSAALIAVLRRARIPATVSGAGPSVLAWSPPGAPAAWWSGHCPAGWAALPLAIDRDGARILPAGPAGNTPVTTSVV